METKKIILEYKMIFTPNSRIELLDLGLNEIVMNPKEIFRHMTGIYLNKNNEWIVQADFGTFNY
jgi:hypothetical protein